MPRTKVDNSAFITETRSLSEGLARRSWSLIVDGRDPALLEQAHGRLWKLIPPGSHVGPRRGWRSCARRLAMTHLARAGIGPGSRAPTASQPEPASLAERRCRRILC